MINKDIVDLNTFTVLNPFKILAYLFKFKIAPHFSRKLLQKNWTILQSIKYLNDPWENYLLSLTISRKDAPSFSAISFIYYIDSKQLNPLKMHNVE